MKPRLTYSKIIEIVAEITIIKSRILQADLI